MTHTTQDLSAEQIEQVEILAETFYSIDSGGSIGQFADGSPMIEGRLSWLGDRDQETYRAMARAAIPIVGDGDPRNAIINTLRLELDGSQSLIASLTEALEAHDKATAACPVRAQNISKNTPCPKCKAKGDSSCGLDDREAWNLIATLRAALASAKGAN